MNDNLEKSNSYLPLETIPQNKSLDIHLYYLEDEQNFFYTVTVNLYKDDLESNVESSTLSRFTIFQIRDKQNETPAVALCNLLGQIINSDYGTTCSMSQIKVYFYQPYIGRLLDKRIKRGCLDKKEYDRKLKKLYETLQNNWITSRKKIQKLMDDLYHGMFIVPIEYADCTNSKELPKFLHIFRTRYAPMLLEAPVDDIKKGVITIYSDSSFDSKTGKFTASCAIFIEGLQGVFCSVDDSTKTEDSTIPELCAMNNACTILKEMLYIQKYRLVFLSDNKNLLHAIKEVQSGKDTKYSKLIYKILAGFEIYQLEFEKANEGNEIFRLVDRESKYFRKVK